MSVISEGIDKLKLLKRDGLFRRIFKNSAMLTGGKIYTAIVGLIYLALATHSLGVHGFGILMLLHAYVAAIRNFTAFKSAQSIVRYGAIYLENDDKDRLQRLIKFTTLLDLASCLCGTVISILAISTVGPWFNITVDLIPMATLYCCVILFNFKSTPLGILRLFNRFDLIAIMLMVIPSIRLIGAGIAFLMYRDIMAFVFVWFIASVIDALTTTWFGWRELRQQQLTTGMNISLHALARPHDAIWSFTGASYIHTMLGSANTHISTLAVGFFLGPVGAGLFKVAQELATILRAPTQLFTETIYPEMTKIVSSHRYRKLWKVIKRAAMVAATVAGGVYLIIALSGKPLLGWVFGVEFIAAYSMMLLLMLGAAISMATFAFDPAMYAIGRPGVAMKIRIITSTLHVLLLIILLINIGLPGAGIASIISSFATAMLLFLFARRLIRDAEVVAP